MPLAFLMGPGSASSPRTPEPVRGDALLTGVKEMAALATTTTTAPITTTTTLAEAPAATTPTTTTVAPSGTVTKAARGTATKTTPPKKTQPRAPAGTFSVPETIAADCSRPVESELMAFFSTVPDTSTIVFPPGKCYGHDGTIRLVDRVGLVIDGNGSTFKALTDGSSYVPDHGNRAHWRISGGANITLKNMTVRGAHPSGGVSGSAYVPRFEGQHGYEVGGTQGALLENLRAFDVYGDFVAVQWERKYADNVTDAPPARDVTIRKFYGERNGRQGLFIGHGERVTLEGSYMGHVNQNAVDLEPDVVGNWARDIRIVNNTFGPTHFSLLAALTADASNVTFSGNRMDAAGYTCQPAVTVEGGPGVYKVGFTIEDNAFRQSGPAYWRSAFDLRYTRNVSIRRNTVALDRSGGCGARLAGVLLIDSHDVTVTDNSFAGSEMPVAADGLSSGVTVSRNSV